MKHIQLGHIEYKKALEIQEEIFQKIIKTKIENRKNETEIITENFLISCSHPHVYTIGKVVMKKIYFWIRRLLKIKN